jgi:hypothetical protein
MLTVLTLWTNLLGAPSGEPASDPAAIHAAVSIDVHRGLAVLTQDLRALRIHLDVHTALVRLTGVAVRHTVAAQNRCIQLDANLGAVPAGSRPTARSRWHFAERRFTFAVCVGRATRGGCLTPIRTAVPIDVRRGEPWRIAKKHRACRSTDAGVITLVAVRISRPEPREAIDRNLTRPDAREAASCAWLLDTESPGSLLAAALNAHPEPDL